MLIRGSRGKKVFRPYEDTLPEPAGAVALGYEPVRRSRTKPRRLTFGREPVDEEVDEEAETDIELGHAVAPAYLPTAEAEEYELAADKGSPKRGRGSALNSWPRVKSGSSRGSRKRDAGERGDPASKRVRSAL